MAIDSPVSAGILDLEGALARLGGDKSLFSEMAGIVLEDAPQRLALLIEAVSANDAHSVRMHAHALKGLVAGCGGNRAAKAAQALEDAGAASDLIQVVSLLQTFKKEFEQLTASLRQCSAAKDGRIC
jgi:HPt (histidine-containing phosphotransfer) domain-containing protein